MDHHVDDETIRSSTTFDVNYNQSVSRQAIAELPVIDISAFLDEEGDVAERKATADKIRRACIDIGFFYLTGHSFSSAELKQILQTGMQFFELPLATKMTIAANSNPYKLGYIQTGGLTPDANANSRPDLKERLFLSRELGPGETPVSGSNAGYSQWLAPNAVPGFEPVMRSFTARCVTIARALNKAFAMSLGLPEQVLESLHDHMQCSHALNYYPSNPVLDDPSWGFTPHTDYGSFTLLLQDENGGLQAMNAAERWIEVPPIDGTFVVNLGDLMARATNDVYISTLHRVLNRSTSARLSMAFFVSPDPNATVSVLETCVSELRPARYPPVVSGDYLSALLAQAHRTGRSGVSLRTAERLKLK